MPADTPALPSRLDVIYREHFPFVWRSARRMGVRGALLDDVVQDTFLVVHRRMGEFEGRASLKTWLYGILRRVVADHRRTRKRRPGDCPSEAAPDDALSAPSDATSSTAEHAERAALAQRLLAQLRPAHREVLVLAELEGMTMAEIAEATGANVNTVASRLRAARRDLERAIDDAESAASRAVRPHAGEARTR